MRCITQFTLYKKHMSKERKERFALGHKTEEYVSKTDEKYEFFRGNCSFLREIQLNRS